jgi:hypothetical protein
MAISYVLFLFSQLQEMSCCDCSHMLLLNMQSLDSDPIKGILKLILVIYWKNPEKTARYDRIINELCHFYKVSLLKTGSMFHKYHLLNQLQVFMRYKKDQKEIQQICKNNWNYRYLFWRNSMGKKHAQIRFNIKK